VHLNLELTFSIKENEVAIHSRLPAFSQISDETEENEGSL